MSIEDNTPAEGGTPTYITRFDGVRVPATGYHPVWLGYQRPRVRAAVVPAPRAVSRSVELRMGSYPEVACPAVWSRPRG